MKRRALTLLAAAGLLVASTQHLIGDFFCKVPEFNPGDAAGGYDLFKPPWYPYNIEEAEKYTVTEGGEIVERPEEDRGLLDYDKKVEKPEAVKTHMKKAVRKIIFDRVLGSPKAFVADFYGHCGALGKDVAGLSADAGWTQGAGSTRHNLHNIVKRDDALNSGYPPIPGQRRLLYDSWAVAVQTGWGYGKFGEVWGGSVGGNAHYPSNWRGYLVPNLREFAVWYSMEGVATSVQCIALLERNPHKERRFSPELTVLKAISGEDYGWDAGKWHKNFVNKVYNADEKPWPQDYTDWDKTVGSLMMLDLTRKRVPLENAFHRLRDVPELSEPIFLDLVNNDKANRVMKRNLAALLEGYTSPRAAHALHKLARDKDTVTALRAVTSLARHPHGRVRALIKKWLDPKIDDVRRNKAILMMGYSGESEFARMLMEFYPKCADDHERELVLRALLRLKHKPAMDLFKEAKGHKHKPLDWIGRMGLSILNDGDDEYKAIALDLISKSFYRADAIPTSGTIVSFAQHLRVDTVKWMARSRWKEVRRKLWLYIREFQDLGPGSEEHGVAHLLAFALGDLELGDDIIPTGEAVKCLNMLAARTETDTLIRMAALARLYEFDRTKAMKICDKLIARFLKGRKIEILGWNNADRATELDVLAAAVNIKLIDNPKDSKTYERILLNPNIGGLIKSQLLETLYKKNRKTALKIIKKSIDYYAKKSEPTHQDKRYLIRLIRFAGMFKDKKVLTDVVRWMEKSPDPWVRFVSLYSCRLGLESDAYGNVLTGTSQERRKIVEQIKAELSKLK